MSQDSAVIRISYAQVKDFLSRLVASSRAESEADSPAGEEAAAAGGGKLGKVPGLGKSEL